MESEYITPKELAKKLNVSLKSITNWTQYNRIPGQKKIGRVWRYRKIEVERRLRNDTPFLLN